MDEGRQRVEMRGMRCSDSRPWLPLLAGERDNRNELISKYVKEGFFLSAF